MLPKDTIAEKTKVIYTRSYSTEIDLFKDWITPEDSLKISRKKGKTIQNRKKSINTKSSSSTEKFPNGEKSKQRKEHSKYSGNSEINDDLKREQRQEISRVNNGNKNDISQKRNSGKGLSINETKDEDSYRQDKNSGSEKKISHSGKHRQGHLESSDQPSKITKRKPNEQEQTTKRQKGVSVNHSNMKRVESEADARERSLKKREKKLRKKEKELNYWQTIIYELFELFCEWESTLQKEKTIPKGVDTKHNTAAVGGSERVFRNKIRLMSPSKELKQRVLKGPLKRCKPICRTCDFLESGYHVTESEQKCSKVNVVYGIYCWKCKKFVYVGQTETRLKDRINRHLRDVINNRPVSLARHFRSDGHSESDIGVTLLFEEVDDKYIRRWIESQAIVKLNTVKPNGLNIQKKVDRYQLSSKKPLMKKAAKDAIRYMRMMRNVRNN